MSDIIKALLNAVETREIDLSECAEMYNGAKLPIRVNWPRYHKKRRYELSRELGEIQKAYTASQPDDDIEDLGKRADENAASWIEWWSVSLMMEVDEVATLKDSLPVPHWEWLTNRIVDTVNQYEVDETKKALVSRGRISGEREQ